ncbi:helix-turn-helix domain-containing protein [Gaoshiqia sp. Z1-71]|uniref:helix-turn-helix domain-containing protein n=1 Tax=Gaoshiqia hydrogeniformans TaxID=3290090 RepID=UPI003BF7A75D
MTSALNKLRQLESKETSSWLEEAKTRQENKAWRRRSFQIAVRILREIRAQKPVNGMTQKVLAEKMGVTPQYINKVVKGKENLTLETISKIEEVLGIQLVEVSGVVSAKVKNVEPASDDRVCSRNAQVSMKKTIQLTDYFEFEPEYQPNGTDGY